MRVKHCFYHDLQTCHTISHLYLIAGCLIILFTPISGIKFRFSFDGLTSLTSFPERNSCIAFLFHGCLGFAHDLHFSQGLTEFLKPFLISATWDAGVRQSISPLINKVRALLFKGSVKSVSITASGQTFFTS